MGKVVPSNSLYCSQETSDSLKTVDSLSTPGWGRGILIALCLRDCNWLNFNWRRGTGTEAKQNELPIDPMPEKD
jgi:hypothetical protein